MTKKKKRRKIWQIIVMASSSNDNINMKRMTAISIIIMADENDSNIQQYGINNDIGSPAMTIVMACENVIWRCQYDSQ